MLRQFIPISRSCSIVPLLMSYAGLPPVLGGNPTCLSSFSWFCVFKISEIFLDNVVKESDKDPNKVCWSKRQIAQRYSISIAVYSSSLLCHISNPIRSDSLKTVPILSIVLPRECKLSPVRSIGDNDFLRVISWACWYYRPLLVSVNYLLCYVAIYIFVNVCCLPL